MSKRSKRPTLYASLVMCFIAALSVGAWLLTEAADEWMPNVATTAIGIATTITFVEWIVRREKEERLRPRTERVLYWLGLDIRLFAVSLLHDYASTHIDSYRSPSMDVMALIGLSAKGRDSEDAERHAVEQDGRRAPMIVLEASDLARRLDTARQRGLDVLEPALVRQIDDFAWAAVQASQLCVLGDEMSENYRVAAGLVIDHFRDLAEAFFESGAEGWRQLPELSVRATDETHRHLVAQRRAAQSGVD
jgi:hypothetical protein